MFPRMSISAIRAASFETSRGANQGRGPRMAMTGGWLRFSNSSRMRLWVGGWVGGWVVECAAVCWVGGWVGG